jgi:type IV pilus assembly protein PilW
MAKRIVKNQSNLIGLQTGLSMIELLVALGLGLLISAAVTQVFLSSRQTERLEQALSQVQDTGRFALDLMVSDLQRIGYLGCNTPQYLDEYNADQTTNIFIIANDTGLNSGTFSQEALAGFENTGGGILTPTPPSVLKTYLDADTLLTSRGVANSDVLSFYFGKEEPNTTLAADHSAASNNAIQITNNSACMMQGDLFMLTNCSATTIARISNTLTPACSSTTTNLQYAVTHNSTATIDPEYLMSNSKFMSMIRVNYYVGDTGRTDRSNRPIRALYRRVNNSAAQEVIDGVESLQIEYGELIEGTSNTRFVKANTAGLDMGRVISLRIGILVRGTENVLDNTDTTTYEMPGQDIGSASTVAHAGGKVLRRAFITTVQLRNRT